MQPLEIAKGNPTAIPRAEDDDAGLASSTWTATAATDELNGDRLSSTEAVSRRRSNDNNISRNNTNNNTTIPDSPRSFDSNELFEDVLDETIGEYGMDRITDDDLERLMWNSDEGQRNYRRHQQNNSNTNRSSFIFQQYHQIRSWLCPCCPPRRHKIGNMIILLPYYCVTKFKCGIMGPHWFGPIACFTLLSGATSRLVPRSYRTIGPITGQICLGLYLVSVLLLGLVVCRDPGVVRSTAMMEDEEEQVEQENVGEDEGTDGIAGRVESGRSGGRSGRGRGLTGRGSGGGQLEAARVSNTNGNRRRGAGDGWRYCDICSLYQPPGAVHCPDCNVCIKGWDHHCPWMGTCIGEKNYTPFLAFNLTWLIYLFFAIIWVLNAPLHYVEPPRGVAPDDDDET